MPLPSSSLTVAQVVQRGLMAAQGSSSVNTVNIWYFRRTTTTNPVNKLDISADFQAAIGDTVAAALNASWSATFNDVRFMNDAEDAYQSFSQTAVGGVSGDRMPSYAAAFILGKTGLRGRRFMTRKLLGPMSESDTTAGTADVFNAAATTRLTAVETAWVNGFTDSDGNVWVPVVLSGPPLSQVKVNPTTITVNDIISARTNHRVSTLIRRKTKTVY